MSSSQKVELLKTIAARMNAGDLDGLETHFTDDFVLHDPGAPDWPRGRGGVRKMISSFSGIEMTPLDFIEQGDRVCVRWSYAGVRDGEEIWASAVAIYRFEGNKIAEDWGVVIREPWP